MARTTAIASMDQHPNALEISEVLSRVGLLGDEQLGALAAAWRNSSAVAEARRRALEPDTPLVLEVLAAFDALGSLYADDLAGGQPWVSLPPEVTAAGLRAARDAIAAAYARPVLGRSSYQALLGAWRSVFPAGSWRAEDGDLGPAHGQVLRLAGQLAGLAERCHDPARRAQWSQLSLAAALMDQDAHAGAARRAWDAAVAAGRRRAWMLVARSTSEALSRSCPHCRRRTSLADAAVLQLGRDATCGLLARDLLSPTDADRLLGPVAHLLEASPAAER